MGDFHHWSKSWNTVFLELDLTPILGTSQSTLEDGHGGLPESPEYPKEGSPPHFGVWEEEKGGEVLDRHTGTATHPSLRGHFLS